MNMKFSNASLDDLFGPDEAWRRLPTPELEELYEAVHERGLDWSDPRRGVRAARACIELVVLCDLVADADTRTSYLMWAIRIDPFDDDVLGDYVLEVSQTGYRCAVFTLGELVRSLGATARSRELAVLHTWVELLCRRPDVSLREALQLAVSLGVTRATLEDARAKWSARLKHIDIPETSFDRYAD